MISFLEYFEEKIQQRELLYHITDGKNLKGILKEGLVPNKSSNFEDDSSEGAHSKQAYGGVYLGRNLKELMMTVDDWGIIDYSNVGVIVVESRGYNQLFMDEDNLTNMIPYIKSDQLPPLLDQYVDNDFKSSKAMNDYIVEFLTKLKGKFFFNNYQRDVIKEILIPNAPVLIFRGVDRNKKADPEKVQEFLNHFNKPDTESWFREVFNKLTRLRLKFKKEVTEFDLDSNRVTKNITFSGNPRIVGMYRIQKDKHPAEIIYSRLDETEESSIIETAQDVADYYTL